MATTSTSTTSAINFNIENLVGRIMLNDHLLGYFMDGEISTLNVYYINNGCEMPFLVKIRKDYISMTNAWNNETVIRINMIDQKDMIRRVRGEKDWLERFEKADSKIKDFKGVIITALEQYLNHLADEGVLFIK
jgi:hypothetical protein